MKKLIRPAIWVSLIAVTLAFTAFTLISNQEKAEAKVYHRDPNTRVSVTTAVVGKRDLTGQQQFTGAFEPVRENKIAAEVSGKVVFVGVQEGDAVRAGQVLARLDNEAIQLQIEAAEVQLEGVVADVNRYTKLAQSEAIPGVNLEKALIQKRSIEVQLKTLRDQLNRTTLTAPFGGVVTQRFFDLGSVLAPGAPLAQLTDISGLKLAVAVPEEQVLLFRTGQSVQISVDAWPGIDFSGKVRLVGVQADAAHNFPVEVLVQNSQKHPLKAGMFGALSFQNSAKNSVLALPKAALAGTAKEPRVFVVENGKAVLRSVTLGAANNDYHEILSGLHEGDTVVTSGQISLTDGAAVAGN
ncbi:MAG TPA: efflux RND transporter periplasmic adaptor subunit [Saprospiraceae bacterium]|nr:efflux RND transporter periplasmic adaptor subunit [Saprospiraceae bacterium]